MGPAARVLCGLASALRIFRAPRSRMPLLLGTFVSPVLVALLVLTTPLGTGDSLHQADLLHPLLPHVHLINGKVVTHQASGDSSDAQTTAGPAIGGGAGSDAASAGLGLAPTVPALPEAVLVLVPGRRIAVEQSIPSGRVEAPPDPPPTSLL
jgi:hypothetical protein